MTISATGRRYPYTGDGVTVAFSFPRPFQLNTDLKVYLVLISTGVATLQVLVTDYNVTGAGLDAGGTVTFNVAPSSLYKVVIFADTDATQNLDLDAVTSWPMTSIEYAFDRLTIMVQEIWDRLLRVPFAPREYINTFDYKLPIPVAAYLLGVNGAGTGFEYRTAPTWVKGAGAPGAGVGAVGDMYFDTATADIYGPKTSVWGGIILNIKGLPGTDGVDGTDGTDGVDGADGSIWYEGTGAPGGGLGVNGDFYLNDVNGDVYQKAAGVWGIVANIKGAPGAGSGDVVGPASVTDDLPAIFDGTTGKLLKSKTYSAFKTLLSLVKADVGLGNVDNTSDANKPVSTATATAITNAINAVLNGVSSSFDTLAEIATELALKATINSPIFTGDPKAPTATPGDNDTSIATTAFVAAAVALIGGATRIYKTANQTYGNTSFVADNTLAFPVAANTKYAFTFSLIIDCPSAADIKMQLTGPASPNAVRAAGIAGFEAATPVGSSITTGFSQSRSFVSTAIGQMLTIVGYVDNGANAGTVTLELAQVTNSGTNTTFMGSYVEYKAI